MVKIKLVISIIIVWGLIIGSNLIALTDNNIKHILCPILSTSAILFCLFLNKFWIKSLLKK